MALGPSLPQIGALQLLSARPQVSPRFLRAWHPAFVLARMPTVSTPNPGAGVRGHAPPGPQPRDLIPMSGGSSLGLRPLQPVLHTFSLSPDATFLSPFLPDLLVWDPGCLSEIPALAAPSGFCLCRAVFCPISTSFSPWASPSCPFVPRPPLPPPLRGAGPQAPNASPSVSTRAPSRESWPSTRATWSPSWRPAR